jgi:thiopurine S-methyltransferase
VHHDFWHERWRTGQTGFHQQTVHPLLERWWPGLGVRPGARVYVPLCGKSLDMTWLVGRGHTVLGSELARIGIDEFFAGQSLQPAAETRDGFTHHAAGPYEILEGDALALPPEMRGPCVESLARLLPRGARGLVVSFEYPQEMKGGPPFSVESLEILGHCDGRFTVRELERVDILVDNPKFAEFGIPALHEVAYALERT